MDYYKPPTDHRNAAEMERLQEKLDKLIADRKAMEASQREFTEAMENLYLNIENQIQELNNRLEDLYWENNRG